MTKIITFLGIGKNKKYEEVEFFDEYGNNLKIKHEFSIIGILKLLEKKEFINNCKVLVFTTAKSEELFPKLKEAIMEKFGNLEILKIKYNEKNIWELFDLIMNNINENEKIYLDITHSFRYIPFISSEVVTYLEIVKNVEIGDIFYAELDLENKKATIKSLKSFNTLKKWVLAIYLFNKTGYSNELNLLIKNLKNEKFKNKVLNKSTLTRLSKLSNKINSLYLDIFNANAYELDKEKSNFGRIQQINQYINLIIKEFEINTENKEFLPFVKILNNIKKEINSLKENKILPISLNVAKYCLKHDLLIQTAILMREGFITLLLERTSKNIEDRTIREQLFKNLQYFDGSTNKKEVEEIIQYLKEKNILNEIQQIAKKLSAFRNELAHGEYSNKDNKPKGYEKYKNNFKEILKTIEKIAKKL